MYVCINTHIYRYTNVCIYVCVYACLFIVLSYASNNNVDWTPRLTYLEKDKH